MNSFKEPDKKKKTFLVRVGVLRQFPPNFPDDLAKPFKKVSFRRASGNKSFVIIYRKEFTGGHAKNVQIQGIDKLAGKLHVAIFPESKY